jgi:rubrerythrin
MNNRDAVLEILRRAYQIEVDGHTFYSMTAERAEKPAVRELFEKLAADEVQHQAALREVAGRLTHDDGAPFNLKLRLPDPMRLSDKVFTARFRDEAAGAAFELSVLSVGMQLEQSAIAYFSGAAEKSSEAEVKDFYTFLADWERQHLEALRTLHESVRSDFWSGAGFAPF